MGDHTCPKCGRGFETKRGLGVHHGHIHGESLPNRQCAHCDTEFHCEYEKKYCSEECLSEGIASARTSEQSYSGAKERTECQICETSFEYYPSEKRGLYCPTCVETEQWRTTPNLVGSNNPRWKGGKQTASCEICEETVERWPSEFTDVTLCSGSCRSKWLADTFVGENHPNWKDTEKLAYGPGWDRIRRLAVKRDGYRCQICGITKSELGQNPDVHHIIPVRWFVKSEDHTRADAHSLENVISLCRSCHRQAEHGRIPQQKLESQLRQSE